MGKDYCGTCGTEINIDCALTKREYFASNVMQALLSRETYMDADEIIEASFLYADKFIKESEK